MKITSIGFELNKAKIVELVRKNGKIHLSKSMLIEEMEENQLYLKVNEIINKEKIDTQNLIISSQKIKSDFLYLRIPRMSRSEVKKYILKKIISMRNLEEKDIIMTYLSQKAASDEKTNNFIEVFAFYTLRTEFMQYLKLLSKCGLNPQFMIPEEVALWNSFNYIVDGSSGSKVTALVNLGDNVIDVIFMKGKNLIFKRTITSGVEEIIRAISNDLVVDYTTTKNIFFSDKNSNNSKTEIDMNLLIENSVGDISRTFSNFSRQENLKIEKVLFTGEGTNSERVKNIIKKTLPLEFSVLNFKEEKGFISSEKKSVSDLTLPIGLALHSIKRGNNLNMIPEELVEGKFLKTKLILTSLISMSLILILLLQHILFGYILTILKKNISLNKQILKSLTVYDNQYLKISNKNNEIYDRIESDIKIKNREANYYLVFKSISDSMPDGVYLSSLNIIEEKQNNARAVLKCFITNLNKNLKRLDVLISNLEKTNIFKEVSYSFPEHIKLNEADAKVEFEIEMVVKK